MQTALITSLPPPLTPEKRANKNAAFDVAAKSWLAFFSSTTTTATTTITSCGVRAQGWKRAKIKRKGGEILKDRIMVPANLPVISGERWTMVEGVDDDTRRWSVISSPTGIYRVILNHHISSNFTTIFVIRNTIIAQNMASSQFPFPFTSFRSYRR